jgi:tetratricopeptide (TPR) repeat protein/SAM-dependent methyltransferase
LGFSFRRLLGRHADDGATPDRGQAERCLQRGIAADEAGDAHGALKLFDGAVAADASFAAAHMNRGIALQAVGRLDDAVTAHERALALDPTFVAAHFNLALAHAARGEPAAAEARFRACLSARPDMAEAWVGLAGALEDSGRPDDALDALQRALALRPDHVGALLNAGALLRRMGRLDDAVANDRRLIGLEPGNADVHERLATALRDTGRAAEAEATYRNALRFAPDHAGVNANLALLLFNQGRPLDSVPFLFKAMHASPENAQLKRMLVPSLHGVEIAGAGTVERSVLQRLCADPNVSTRCLAHAVAALLRSHAGLQHMQRSAAQGEDPFADPATSVKAFIEDPLVLAALPTIAIADPLVESALTHARRWLCARAAATPVNDAEPIGFICALARQSFFTSYAMHVTEAEARAITQLRAALEATLADGGTLDRSLEHRLATIAMYDPLHTLAGSARLLDVPPATWSDAFRPLVDEQLRNRRRERELAGTIGALTDIDDRVSVAVRAQYEENPYPRWLSAPDPGADRFEALWERLHGHPPEAPHPRPVPVLVAGCGTGHHSIQVAHTFPDADILAVDLSLASLAYAARMTEARGIRNVTYRQADLLNLGVLERRFAVIECGGVLHHLDDPMAGWRVLRGLLEPQGLMHIALYSEKAREPMRAARACAATIDIEPTAEGMRRCRQAIMALPSGHPARAVTTLLDFYSLDEFRDLILHVREHCFTLPQVGDCLRALDLRLLSLEVPAEIARRFAAEYPGHDAKTDLAAWDRFETDHPETFRGMYVFWCAPV